MWEYRHTEELNHAEHKYIAKIGEGVKARYFYTQEALNAYKKALSSKDEKAALDKALDGPGVTKGANGAFTIEGRENIDRVMKAEGDYAEASSLKGKAKAVAETFKERNPNAGANVKKAAANVKEAADAYGKALSSDDELQEYYKSSNAEYDAKENTRKADIARDHAQSGYEKAKSATVKNRAANVKIELAKGDAISTKEDAVKKAKNIVNAVSSKDEQKAYEKAERDYQTAVSNQTKAANKTDAALKNYERANTLKGKAQDVAEVFNERNPETVKKLKRGRDFINGLFR